MKRYLGFAALALLLVAFFGLFSTPLWDIDLWWHLATGREIVANAAIPDRDPFGVYEIAEARGITILKCYWAVQVLFYLVMRHLGPAGLIALKASLLVGCLVVLHRRASAAAHPAATYLVMALAGLALLSFTGERPQLVSFLLAGVVFLLLDRYEEEGRTAWLYPVPAVMLLWANCHGGVVLGAVLLVVHAAARAAVRWRAWSTGAARERNVFLAVIALSLLMAVASPAGWSSFLTVVQLEGTEFKSRVSEYASPWALWRDQRVFAAPPYAALLGLALAALVPLVRARKLEQAAVVLVLAALSLTTFRYVPFFVLVAGPYVAVGLTRLCARFLPREAIVHGAVIAGAAAALVLGLRGGWMFQGGQLEGNFPAGAVAQLQRDGASGKVLSSFEWGGYVIWNTDARVRPYVDGRNLDMHKFAVYTNMIWATPQGLGFFEREGFDYVLLPRASPSREEYPLNQLLMRDPRWRLVYRDAGGFLFSSRATR